MQKKYRFFKKFSPFYRNSSVTKSPKTLQLCCASRQNRPSATASAHFLGHFGAFRFVYHCIYMHRFAYRGFCVRFVALRCVPFCVPFLWSKSELLCSGWHNSSFIKNTKKRPLHKNVQRPLTIQAMLLNNAQEQAITEQPLLPRSA